MAKRLTGHEAQGTRVDAGARGHELQGARPYQHAVCRGSFALGTACGTCERCKEELRKNAVYRPPTAQVLEMQAELEMYEAIMDDRTQQLHAQWRAACLEHAARLEACKKYPAAMVSAAKVFMEYVLEVPEQSRQEQRVNAIGTAVRADRVQTPENIIASARELDNFLTGETNGDTPEA